MALTIEEIDAKLSDVNSYASMYEAFTIKSIVPEEFTVQKYEESLSFEFLRLGERLSDWLVSYILATIWCYTNTPVEETDLILVDRKKHAHLGKELVSNYKNLIGMYFFPLVLYGAEYIPTIKLHLKPDDIDPAIFGYNSSNELWYESFLSATIETAIQARYWHLRECHLRRDLGDEEFLNTNFSDQYIEKTNIIIPED